MDDLSAGAPLTEHDLAWLETKAAEGPTSDDPDDDRGRQSLVAYFSRA